MNFHLHLVLQLVVKTYIRIDMMSYNIRNILQLQPTPRATATDYGSRRALQIDILPSGTSIFAMVFHPPATTGSKIIYNHYKNPAVVRKATP